MSEENKLSLTQRFQLWFHLTVCKVCKACSKQSLWIAKVSRNIEVKDAYSEQEKHELKEALSNDLKG